MPSWLPDVVERADVRMVQRGDALCASRSKRCFRSGSRGKVRGQHLDGDRAIEPRVGGLVDLL